MGEIQFHGTDSDAVSCLLVFISEASMELVAILHDLRSQFGSALGAIDPQLLGE